MVFGEQYEFVKSSRKVLLAYCQTLRENDFLVLNSSFVRGSVRNLLVHIGNTYEYWIGQQALGRETRFTDYNFVVNAKESEAYFFTIDSLVEEFIAAFSYNYLTDIALATGTKIVTANPLKIFTHVITHEYHHKGQVLSLTRHLGYTPIDTDVIR